MPAKPETTAAPDTTAEDDDSRILNATLTQARTEGHTAGEKAGADAAYARISAILADEKVKGREMIAIDLAVKSRDMSAADVVAFVSGLAAPTPAATVPKIEDRMAGQGAALALGGPTADPAKAKVEVPKASDIYAGRRKAREARATH